MTWRPLPGPQGSEPKAVGQSLDAVVRRLGGPGARAVAVLFERWADIAGDGPAKHCRPVAVTEGTLLVAVDDPARASQLRFAAAPLLARVRQVVGPGVAERVEVRVRPPGHRRH